MGVLSENNFEFSTEVVIKRMAILNFENIMLLKKHLKKSENISSYAQSTTCSIW